MQKCFLLQRRTRDRLFVNFFHPWTCLIKRKARILFSVSSLLFVRSQALIPFPGNSWRFISIMVHVLATLFLLILNELASFLLHIDMLSIMVHVLRQSGIMLSCSCPFISVNFKRISIVPSPQWYAINLQVLVMSSIRKPKRLIIRGDDEKDHTFLAKGGEDLRLDQRIEQVRFVLLSSDV